MQMKIEILDSTQNMAPIGSSVLNSMQNNSAPILDLLIRESIQNSLDASKDGSKYVSVDYQIGKFLSTNLNKHFETISKKLDKNYPNDYFKYLIIRDGGTTGLTGKMRKDQVLDGQDLGNLIKLVYDIQKPQENKFAGGSWGIGKTIYFRVGIGLVIYYSNIFNVASKSYESRLAACMVEDEKKNTAYLPAPPKCSRKSGIAWWGRKLSGKEKTVPITDKKYIEEFLEIFDLKPYEEQETGTTIIIPYLKEEILTNNIKQVFDGTPRKLYWHNTLEEYLRIAIQRWYCPRLENKKYSHGCYLKASINGQTIERRDFEPAFLLIQDLYNRAATDAPSNNYEDSLKKGSISAGVEEIKLNGIFNMGSSAGKVAWCKVSNKYLKICAPDNKEAPYLLYDMDIKDEVKNKPILTFCRMHGMLVSYVQDGDWLSSVPSCNTDEYIIAIFVLNSLNTLRIDGSSLDEYMRAGERSDHINWEDHTINNKNLKLVQKIQHSVAKKLSQCFTDNTDDKETRLISGLSQLLGNLILPPEDFGKDASGTEEDQGGGNNTGGLTEGSDKGGGGYTDPPVPPRPLRPKKPLSVRFLPAKTDYYEKEVSYYYYVLAKPQCDKFFIEVKILREDGDISMRDWCEGFGITPPFELNGIVINNLIVDGKEVSKIYKDDNNIGLIDRLFLNDNDINISLRSTDNKKINYGAEVSLVKQCLYAFELKVTLSIYSRDIKPVLSITN